MKPTRDKYPNVFGVEKDWLCHYTSFDNLCSILSTMTLRVSSYERSNDISEMESNIFMILDSSFRERLEQYITRNCGYISFSKNEFDKETDTILSVGYRIPSMWGLYADGSRGACLVLDKEKLEAENSVLSKHTFNEWLDVDYTKMARSKVVPRNTPLRKIVKDNYKKIFGYKHSSWSHEQERRLIGIDMPPSLSIKNGVIKGIVMGCRSTENDKNRLKTIINDSNLACFGQIDKRQWVWQECLDGDIYTSDLGTYWN